MNLKKSWVNLPLLKNIIKQNTLLAKISLIAVISFLIIGMLGDGLKAISYALFGLSAIILTTCYAGFIQKYMTRKNEANFVASLPIDSFVLWFTHYFAGLLLVVIPLCIESVLLVCLQGYVFGPSISDFIFTFPTTTVLLAIIYYTISFFVSCMAGNRFGQFIYTVVFYALPFLLYVAINGGGQLLSIGNVDTFNYDIMGLFMPLTSGLSFISGGTWNFAFWHIIITIAFFVGGYYIFKNRSIENTGEALLYKNINIGLRVILVVTVSLSVFTIFVRVINIIPNYHINNILLGGVIFVVLGCLLALLIEITFKNYHMYKSLLYYLPIFVISYFGCYLYAQYTFSSLQDKVFVGEEVNFKIAIYNRDNQYSNMIDGSVVQIKTEDAKRILDEIQSHPEKILKIDWFVSTKNYAQISISNIKQDKYDYDSFYVEVDTDYLDEILMKNREVFKANLNITTAKQIENSDQEYWYLYDDPNAFYQDSDAVVMPEAFLTAVLTKEEVKNIVSYMQSDAYLQEKILTYTNYYLKTKTGSYTIGIGDIYMGTIFENEQIMARTENVRNSIEQVTPYKNSSFDDILSLSSSLKEISDANEVLGVKEINPGTDVIMVDDNTVIVNVTYTYYDETKEKTMESKYMITFTLQGDEIRAIKVEGGETNVAAI